jgi:hypothetical protein
MRAYIAALVVTAWFVDFGQRLFHAIGFSTARYSLWLKDGPGLRGAQPGPTTAVGNAPQRR